MISKGSYATPWENCFTAASEKYQISKELLQAIAYVESRYDPNALNPVGKERGVMQIHPWWFEKLMAQFGLKPDDLWKPCTNIQVGAWILKQEINRYGLSWTAIGAYNAGAYQKNKKEKYTHLYSNYAKKVEMALNRNK